MRLTLKNLAKAQNKNDTPVIVSKSTLPIDPNASGCIASAAPSTRNTLNILLPMTLPRASSGFPFSAAVMETASSGSEVPAATIVRAMTASLIPNFLATPEAPSTKFHRLR